MGLIEFSSYPSCIPRLHLLLPYFLDLDSFAEADMNKVAFSIGGKVQFGEEWHVVVRYHKIGGNWGVMFRSLKTGKHLSVSCSQLERFI